MPNSVRFGSAFLCALLWCSAPAQMIPGSSDPAGFPPEEPDRSAEGEPVPLRTVQGVRAFDVTHYAVSLSTDMVSELLSGHVRIAVRLLLPQDTLRLNAVKLEIDSVRVNGVPAGYRVDSTLEGLNVSLAGARAAGESLLVDVSYRRLPGVKRPSSRRGWYFFAKDSLVPPNPANLGYTMSEPSDARFWMPCYDEPWDKASAEIAICVPNGYVAASNGKLVSTVLNRDGTLTWRWREDHPIATYLMCVTVSRYCVPALPFVRTPGDTVQLQYYVWPRDSAECAGYLPTVRTMVEALSSLFGEYPFDKYGMTTIVPFGLGGMEHQTLTSLNWYSRVDELTVVHELAHQWWGDLVTCGTWADIWLNESFATYSEALWRETLGGGAALRSIMRARRHFSSGSWAGAPYNPAGQGFGLFFDVVYNKGAWVLHTLRGVVGDTLFFRTLNAYRQRYQGSGAVTQDFRAVADSVAGRDLGWFFDEWVYGTGWPTYALGWRWGKDTLVATIYQQQLPGWRKTYVMPLQLRAYGAGHDTTVTVWNDSPGQSFWIPVRFKPDSVVLDPDSWVLHQSGTPPAAVDEEPRPLALQLEQNFPNPFNPDTRIRFHLAVPGTVRLSVHDILGREVALLVNERRAAGRHVVEFNGPMLASGMYLARLQAGGALLTRKMLLLR